MLVLLLCSAPLGTLHANRPTWTERTRTRARRVVDGARWVHSAEISVSILSSAAHDADQIASRLRELINDKLVLPDSIIQVGLSFERGADGTSLEVQAFASQREVDGSVTSNWLTPVNSERLAHLIENDPALAHSIDQHLRRQGEATLTMAARRGWVRESSWSAGPPRLDR